MKDIAEKENPNQSLDEFFESKIAPIVTDVKTLEKMVNAKEDVEEVEQEERQSGIPLNYLRSGEMDGNISGEHICIQNRLYSRVCDVHEMIDMFPTSILTHIPVIYMQMQRLLRHHPDNMERDFTSHPSSTKHNIGTNEVRASFHDINEIYVTIYKKNCVHQYTLFCRRIIFIRITRIKFCDIFYQKR